MTKERKKKAAEIVRGFYLYPYKSREENFARGIVWIVSWFLGIVLQWEAEKQALGSAYFIFALSLIMEFLQGSNPYRLVRFVQDLFRILLFVLLANSILLIFWNLLPKKIENLWICQFMVRCTPYVCGAICIRILVGTLLALTKAHKYIYDEKLETQCKMDTKKEEERKRFQDRLRGYSEWRNT